MFRSKTVFVVGAGASKEVGLPLGNELANQIASQLNYRFSCGELKSGDAAFLAALQRRFGGNGKLQQHIDACIQISNGIRLVKSIDNYVDIHQRNACVTACGKAAIVQSILNAEYESRLHRSDMALNYRAFEDTWLFEFGRILVDGVKLEYLDRLFNNISIICFNYDRCIEEFLSHFLSSVYAIELSRAREIVTRLRILRPYGYIKGPAFGDNRDDLDFFELSSEIKTYTEQIEDRNLLKRIHRSLAGAETVVFLGFAFHQPNMELLLPNSKRTAAKRVFASAYRFSPHDTKGIEADIYSLLKDRTAKPPPDIFVNNNLKCGELLQEYKRTLITLS